MYIYICIYTSPFFASKERMSRKLQTLHILQEGGKGSLVVVQTLLGKGICRGRMPELEKEIDRESLRETNTLLRTHMYKSTTPVPHRQHGPCATTQLRKDNNKS
uniref:Uncharacterized protein n=1 Tax=Rhipicephalus zambeziensis TaxID=60191 RepID=A0A224YGV5_9ACAR